MTIIRVLYCLPFILITVLLLYWFHKSHEQIWVKGYSTVDYLQTSQANEDPWRWREPNNKLRIPYNAVDRPGVKNTPEVSSFVFRAEFRLADFIYPCSGIALICFDLSLICSSTISITNFLLAVATYFGLFCLGLLLLQHGDRALQIDLYPDRIEIIARFASLFPRTFVYNRRQLLSIKGKVQSFWTMERGQIQPDYKLIIQQPLLSHFQINQTFRLRCDPTQGSWIVGGLRYWKSLSRKHSRPS